MDDNKIKSIDAAMNEMTFPSEIGRVTKSMSLYKSMKAAEWKNWVHVFSLYCLKGVLAKRHYNLWQLFVRACSHYIQSSITIDEANVGHDLLIMYCKKFEDMYGSKYCTPNMHMHTHIKSCILEFGPTYGFWCFSFERYNGILGSFSTNNHALTITLMKKFVNGLRIEASYQQLEFDNLPTLEDFKLRNSETLGETTIALDYARRNLDVTVECLSNIYSVASVPKLARLPDIEMNEIHDGLIMLLGDQENIEVSRYYQSFNKLRLGRELISCYRKNASQKDCNVIVVYGHIQVDRRPATVMKIGKIDFVICKPNGTRIQESVMFAQVRYFKDHPEKNWFGQYCPMKLYDTLVDSTRFVPIHYIVRKCSITKSKQKFNRLELANGRRSIYKASDVVNFVI